MTSLINRAAAGIRRWHNPPQLFLTRRDAQAKWWRKRLPGALLGVAALALAACGTTSPTPSFPSPASSGTAAPTSATTSGASAAVSQSAAPILWTQVQASLETVLPLLQDRAPTLTTGGSTLELHWSEQDRNDDVITKRDRSVLGTDSSCDTRRRNLVSELDAKIGRRTARVDWVGGNKTALRVYVTQVADPLGVQKRWAEYLTSTDCGGQGYFRVAPDAPGKGQSSAVTVGDHQVQQILLDSPAVPDQSDGSGHDEEQFVFQSTIDQDRLVIVEGSNTDAVTPALVTEIMGALLRAQQPAK